MPNFILPCIINSREGCLFFWGTYFNNIDKLTVSDASKGLVESGRVMVPRQRQREGFSEQPSTDDGGVGVLL